MLSYGFNKSHAASYAYISFQMAYLKRHYTIEFFTALLTVFAENSTKASNYIQDAKQFNIKVLPPDVNRSVEDFTIASDNEILYGFNSVKGLNSKGIVELMEKRPFESLGDLIQKTEKNCVNKSTVKILTLSGALDLISNSNLNRMQMLQTIYEYRKDKDDISEEIHNYTKRTLLEDEKRLLGVYISGHPLEGIGNPIDWEEAMSEEANVIGFALVKEIRRILTKKGDQMSFVVLEFMEKEIYATVFPRQYETPYAFRKGDPTVPVGDLMKEDMILKISGRFEEDIRGSNQFVQEDGSIRPMNFFLQQIAIPVRINKEKSKEIKEMQTQVGIEKEEEEVVEAPSFSFEQLF